MRSQTNAGCCIAVIAAFVLVPATWIVLVLTDRQPDFIADQFRQGLGRKQVQELAIWTQWRLGLRKTSSAEYRYHEIFKLAKESMQHGCLDPYELSLTIAPQDG